MTSVIKDIFPVINDTSITASSLDYAEANALRYTAGYVLQALTKKVNRSANLLKIELLSCLKELMEGIVHDRYCTVYDLMIIYIVAGDSAELCDEDESNEWVKALDRGGLIHISDELYGMFVSMEMELRKHLKLGNNVNIKDTAITEILKNEDVLFNWCLVSINWDEAELNELLKLIIQHWITVCRFSFVSISSEMRSLHKNLKD